MEGRSTEGYGQGFEKGIEEGRKEGEDKRNVEIAKNMKTDGVDYKFISKHTELPVEEIEKL